MKLVRLLFFIVVLSAALSAYFVFVPFGPSAETFVDIPAGIGTHGIATRLEHAGVIRNRYLFEIVRKLKGGTLRAGEYRFAEPATLGVVYARIARGDVYTRALTIPEGFNIFDIAQAVQAAGLGNAQTFLAAEQRNTSLIADLSPHAASLEGFLFPDTYRFSRHTTPDQMLAAMVKRFRQVASQLVPPAAQPDSPALQPASSSAPPLTRLVTLASLVEKEVRVESERPLVAGVFINRLQTHMPLATDPTIIYAALLDHRWRGTIYRSDLHAESPYNTYLHAGLPPGPIANPGLAALRAAANPTPTKYLFFVADAHGHSQFSTSLEQHLQQVQAYRLAEKAPQ